jgi:hypothetical protein
VLIPRHLARTIGLGLPFEQLRVDTVALDKSVDVVKAEPTALVTLDGNDVELADNVAKGDGAVAGHVTNTPQPATRAPSAPLPLLCRPLHSSLQPSATGQLRNRNRAGLINRVDIRGNGGYVVVPPSRCLDGRRYTWINSPKKAGDIPASAPAALIDCILQRGRWEPKFGASLLNGSPHNSARDEAIRKYTRAALENETSKVKSAGRGIRNATLNNAALALGHLVGAGVLGEVEVWTALAAACAANGLLKDDGPRACRATISSGLRHGITEPTDLSKIGTLADDPPWLDDLEGKNPSTGMGFGGFVSDYSWPELKNLPEGLAPVAAFKSDYLPESVAAWAMDIADRMRCPPEMVAIPALTALGSLIGRKCGVRPEQHTDWTEYPNIWGGIVAPPGSLKSPAMQDAMKPLLRLEALAHEEFLQKKAAYENELRNYKLTLSIETSKAKDAAKRSGKPIELQVDEPEEPKTKRYLTNDSSYQKLGELLEVNPTGLLTVRDELVSLLKTLDQEQNADARGFYMTGWNGNSPYTFDRIARGTTRIEAVCLSVLGSATPGAIAEYVWRATAGGRGDDGLIQRFSLLVWPDQVGEWVSADRGLDIIARNKAYDVFDALDELVPTSVGEADPYGGPPFLRFDDRARGRFLEWRIPLERRLRSGELHPALVSHFAKYRKLVPATALIDHLCAGWRTDPIGEPSVARAIDLAGYLESHARRVYGARLETEVAAAKAILSRILAGALEDGFTARDIHRKGWSGLSEIEHVRLGLDLLIDCGWIATRGAPSPHQPGRPTIQYTINPAVQKNKNTLSGGTDKTDKNGAKVGFVGFVSSSPGGLLKI